MARIRRFIPNLRFRVLSSLHVVWTEISNYTRFSILMFDRQLNVFSLFDFQDADAERPENWSGKAMAYEQRAGST